jgi:uncharacterized integral membrane protein
MRRDPEDTEHGHSEAAPPPGGKEPTSDEMVLRQISRERQSRVAKVVVGLAVLVVLILFVLWNSQSVKVNFVFVSGHPPLIWVMLACAVLGGLLGYLVGKPGRQIRVRRRQAKEGETKA